ncbi:MAG: hypothetical protein ABI721_04100 [Candidatus Dojkabacteria bacterium]
MHKLNPRDLPEMKIVDITLPRAIAILVSVTLFFALPVVGITYYQAHPAPQETETVSTSQNIEPKVAGASTEATNPGLIFGIDMNSEQGLLLMIGVIMIGISFILVIFFLLESQKKG